MTTHKFHWPHFPLTEEEAHAIVTLHKAGAPVLALHLQEAVRVTGKRERRCKHLPQLSPAERNRVNGVLLYRLGLELGRIEQRKAA